MAIRSHLNRNWSPTSSPLSPSLVPDYLDLGPTRKCSKMLLAQKIKLEVSDHDAATLEFMQGKCRGLYNWLVMRLRAGEHWHFQQEKAALKACRAYDPELNDVYGKLLAEVYFRLDKAMHTFWKRLEAGEKPGFPKVKRRHQFFTLCYPAMYVQVVGNSVRLPTGGGR